MSSASEQIGDDFLPNSIEFIPSPSSSTKGPSAAAILEAAGRHLPLLSQGNLKFDSILGKGTTFQVNREIYERTEDRTWLPYFVAVKHMIPSNEEHQVRLRYNSAMRELRVLTHPSLVNNDSILPILAYGWTDSPLGQRPYLVVDYSDHGTLPAYLKRITTTLSERRELALDVAAGLKALHESKIIHGDVKPSNVLVFDAREVVPAQMAKLADFGGSIFENEASQETTYGGTLLYNAPEQGGSGQFSPGARLSVSQFYLSDIYSFGITLWEIMNNAESYIDRSWLCSGETTVEFLHRLYGTETDGILRRGLAFCDKTFATQAKPNSVERAVRTTLDLTLTDNPLQRASIEQVIEALAYGTNVQRPHSAYPKSRIHPPSPPSSHVLTPKQPNGIPKAFTGYKLVVQASKDFTIRSFSDNVPYETDSSLLVTLPERPPYVTPSEFHPGELDVFQISMSMASSWVAQCDVVKKLKENEQPNDALQLALCYYLGFGVTPDRGRALELLKKSQDGNSLSQALIPRLLAALEASEKLKDTSDDEQASYFSRRILEYRKDVLKHRDFPQSKDSALLSIIESKDSTLLEQALRDHQYSNREISEALSASCAQGKCRPALQLISVHTEFVPDLEKPSALHWLVMLSDEEAAEIVQALLERNTYREMLDFAPTAGQGTVLLPEHCMELYGTPLHWAVRCRRLKVIKLLVDMGADINASWGGPPTFHSDVPKPRIPNTSPLDIAVTYHLFEIVEYLLSIGANTTGGSLDEKDSTFSCIGLSCLPFSRYIIHGPDYRRSAAKTINILKSHGMDILNTDSNGYDPLLIALGDVDCDSYIIEELLNAGATATSITLDDQTNAAITVAANALYRPYKAENLRLIANLVLNINSFDRFGRNALHYAAVGGSPEITKVILQVPGVDINMRDSKGLSALHNAATFGHTETIAVLLEGGAKIDELDSSGAPALMSAVRSRKISAIKALLDSGASPFFRSESGPNRGTVFHYSSKSAGYSQSITRELLEEIPELQSSSILDATDMSGWTALQSSTYFGDHEAIEALLDYGANCTYRTAAGKTAFDIVVALLKKISLGGLGDDHKRIREKGQQEIELFVAGLKHIKDILQESMES